MLSFLTATPSKKSDSIPRRNDVIGCRGFGAMVCLNGARTRNAGLRWEAEDVPFPSARIPRQRPGATRAPPKRLRCERHSRGYGVFLFARTLVGLKAI